MLKRIVLLAALGAFFVPFAGGCNTTEPTIYSWPLHKRRIKKVIDGWHELHMDVNRIIFDMEEYPIEADY